MEIAHMKRSDVGIRFREMCQLRLVDCLIEKDKDVNKAQKTKETRLVVRETP